MNKCIVPIDTSDALTSKEKKALLKEFMSALAYGSRRKRKLRKLLKNI